MKYSIKPKNYSDKENAKQWELIMNHKSATYDDISEVIKERVDNFELKDDIQEERLSTEAINKMLHDLTEFGMTASYVTSINNGKGFCIQSIKPERKSMKIAIVGCDMMHRQYGLEAAIRAATGHTVEIVGGVEHQMIEAMREQVGFRNEFEILNKYDIENPILQESKDNHPHGWYRKFEKKRY